MKQTQVHELMAFSSLILKNEKVLQYLNEDDLKGWAQNRGLFDRKFKIVRIGRFWRFLCHWTRKICGISWVIIKNSQHKNSAHQLTQNSNVD